MAAGDPPIYAQLAAETGIDIGDVPRRPEPGRPQPPRGVVEDTGDDLAGQLGTVTDVEWRAAHERLRVDMPELGAQLDYVWAPGLDGRRLIRPSERDMAPAPGRYDPNLDERFHGGGFRG